LYIFRENYSIALNHETKLFKLSALQTNALKSLEVIMTSSMCVDMLINPIFLKLKQTDANKNAVNENKKKRDYNVIADDNMNDILSFLFR